MGEYANLVGSGGEIKIGTCENMYYLRYDQRRQIWPIRGSLNPADPETQREIRFRFPWPDEDNNAPGDFDDPMRKLRVNVTHPPEVEHSTIQFVARAEGYLVSLPCPEGPDAETRVNRNGFAGPAFLTQQRVWEGRLVGVLQCTCGIAYRLPTLDDAQPVIDDIRRQASNIRRDSAGVHHLNADRGEILAGDEQNAQRLDTIAERLAAGYDDHAACLCTPTSRCQYHTLP